MRGSNAKNATYLSFIGGEFRERVKEGTENALSREIEKGPNKGKVIWEVGDQWIEGILTGLVVEQGEYSKQWKVKLQDVDETYIITLKWGSGIAAGLLLRLPNVDLSVPIRMIGHYFAADDKVVLTVTQNGQKVDRFWTQEEPKDKPRWKQITVKGEKQWDNTAESEYLERYMMERWIFTVKT